MYKVSSACHLGIQALDFWMTPVIQFSCVDFYGHCQYVFQLISVQNPFDPQFSFCAVPCSSH